MPTRQPALDAHAATRRALLAGAAGGLLMQTARAVPNEVPRLALVIGNGAYSRAPLRNPERDARAVAQLLGGLGFQVIEKRDATREAMLAAIAEAGRVLQGREGVALLYYAGHGLQIDWRNYMLPVDVDLAVAADVPRQAVDVQSVLQAFGRAGTRTNIVVLDACRDNPFASAGGPRGLAPLDAPPGTFLAYATAPGNVAEDGSEAEGNGVYTRFLLQELQRADAPIEDVFKRVRTQVRRATGGRQIPWESTSLEEGFVFAEGRAAPAPTLRQRDAAFDEQREAWARIHGSRLPEDFFAFLQRYPTGAFAELAQGALDRLTRPSVQPQAPAALKVAQLPVGADRFKLGDTWENERINHLAGDRRHREVFTVTAITGPLVEVNGGEHVYDQMGTVLKNDTGVKDPGLLLAPSDIRAGMRWRCDFTNLPRPDAFRARNYYDFVVRGLEEVDVAMGRMRAWHVVGLGRAVSPNLTVDLENEYWLDPATMWSMRTIVRRRRQGRLDVHATVERVAMRRVPR